MEIEKSFKCIEDLMLQKYDEDGYQIDNEYIVINKDSIWEIQEDSSLSDIRLESKDSWIEITLETLESHFKEI